MIAEPCLDADRDNLIMRFGGFGHVRLVHTIIALLIAVTVAIAPLGQATASSRAGGVSHAGQADTATDAAQRAMAGMDMSDCEKMKHASGGQRANTGEPGKDAPGKSDCPCCEKNPGCAPELCLFKCFQLLGAMPTPVALVQTFVSLRLMPAVLDRPPDWSDGPQPPPPRA